MRETNSMLCMCHIFRICHNIVDCVCARVWLTEHPYAATEGGATGYEMRQLQQQNVRLRDTLVRLRDLSAHDKHAMQKMHKVRFVDLLVLKSEIYRFSKNVFLMLGPWGPSATGFLRDI